MCICVCAYTCTYTSAIFIHGELNLGWVWIFPIEYDGKVDRVGEDDCKDMIAMKACRVKAGWGGKCY